MFRKLTCMLFALITFPGAGVFAQAKDLARQETQLAKMYSRLNSFTRAGYDSAGLYSAKFKKELVSLIKNNPATLNYPFKELRDSHFCDRI